MKISETAKLFRTKDNFLLLTHKNPDGDTLGSAAALCSALRRAGKTAFLFPNAEMTEKYRPFAEPFHTPEGESLSEISRSTSSQAYTCSSNWL